ncbi:cytochrome P450 4C1-like isoform X2 [Periplaneta americana]|uniref:cytochrome P450 4C1-like isoform X2 n=1 Tax=Periplaneta americana TaxID=6978 RepID=UPI0037E8CB1B
MRHQQEALEEELGKLRAELKAKEEELKKMAQELLAERQREANMLSDRKVMKKAYVYDYMTPFLGDGLVTSSGEKWKHDRKKLAPFFYFSTLKLYIDTQSKNIDTMIKKLSSYVDTPEFNILPVTMYCALESILTTSVSTMVDCSKIKALLEFTKFAQQTTSYRMLRPWFGIDSLFWISRVRRSEKRCIENMHRILKGFIDNREKTSQTERNSHPSLLDMLLDLKDKNIFTEKDVVDGLITIISAGSDTTATSTSLTCWLLAKHPDIQEKVMEELDEIFGNSNRPTTYEDIVQMKYLERVIKESLRLYPIVPMFGRKLKEDYKTGNYTIPAGANVFVFVWGIHRDPEIFPDPEKFDPDRFLPKNLVNRNDLCYMPFSCGPRNCIGQKYALLFMKSAISGILRKYKLLPGTIPLNFHADVTLYPSTGVNLRLSKRSSIEEI